LFVNSFFLLPESRTKADNPEYIASAKTSFGRNS
jgi:hypothetical protein